MTLIISFCVVFVVGPLLFWWMAWKPPSRHRIAALMAVAVLLMSAAFGIGAWVVPAAGASPLPGLAAIFASWLAWVVMLGYCALALQFRLRSRTSRKIILVIGAMATTLPWFGLYVAETMTTP